MKALAFLAGLGVGNMDEKQRLKREAKDDAREARRNAREDTADARATEIYNAGKTERDRALADDAFVRSESTPIDVAPVATLPETMDARDIGQPGEAQVPVTGYRAGARQFATQGVAQTSADDQLRERRTRALNRVDPKGAQARETQGLQGQAAQLQLKEAARKALNEGVLDAMGAAISGATSDEVMAAYNRTGEKRVAQLNVEPFEINHPTLGKQRSARINGKFEDGTPFQVQDAFASSMDLFGAAKKFDLLRDLAQDKATADDRSADNVRADKALALQADGVKAQRAQLGMQQALSRLQQKAAEAEAKIPPAVKLQYQTIDAELKQIGAAMAKSMAEGQYDPANKGTQELMLRQRELTTYAQRILAPFVDGGKPAAADPLGLFKETAGSPTGAIPHAAAQAARGVGPSAQPTSAGSAPDPMAAMVAKESLEMNQGKRYEFSPPVAAYFEQQKRVAEGLSAAQNKTAIAAEQAALLARSREQLGR